MKLEEVRKYATVYLVAFVVIGGLFVASSTVTAPFLPPIKNATPPTGVHETAYRFKIHEDLPDYFFSLVWSNDELVRILVSNENWADVTQEIAVSYEESSPWDLSIPAVRQATGYSTFFQAIDFNFDGYMDICLHSSLSGNGGDLHTIYLFNPKKSAFEKNDELSELVSIQADPTAKIVTSHWRLGGGEFVDKTYDFVNGQPSLKLYTEFSRSRESKDDDYRYLSRGRDANGQMQVVSEIILKENGEKVVLHGSADDFDCH